MRLKRVQRNACRLVHRAAMVCYQAAMWPIVVTPIAISLVSSLTDVASILTNSGSKLNSEQDVSLLLELEVYNRMTVLLLCDAQPVCMCVCVCVLDCQDSVSHRR